MLRTALGLVLALTTGLASVRGEPLYFIGTLEGAGLGTDAGSSWVLMLQYTPSATAVAAVTQATMTVNRVGGGSYTWSGLDGTKTNAVSVLANLNTLRVRLNWTGDQSSTLGTNGSSLILTVVSPTALPTQVASKQNVDQLVNTATNITGTFDFDPFAPFGESEQALVGVPQAVPEPGSLAVLAVASVLMGRRYLSSRKGKQQTS
ncbi:MAG: hypothetical protein ACK5TG_01660 [Planctomyces sp.]|jgi:hypothetical protein